MSATNEKFATIEAPYCNMSKEKDFNVIMKNKKYIELLNSVGNMVLPTSPVMPVFLYANLGMPWLYENKFPTKEEHDAWNRHCGWIPGKTPTWRNYDPVRKAASKVYVGVDFGLTDGMKLMLEQVPAEKIVYVYLKGMENKFDILEPERTFFVENLTADVTKDFPMAVPFYDLPVEALY